MAGGKENRKSRNLLVRPKVQLKLCLLLSAGFTIILGLIVFVMQNFSQYLNTLLSTNQIDTQTVILITSHLYYYLKLTAGIAGVFAVLGLAIGLWLTHRIFGPVIQISQHISKLIAGDYNSRIHLRSGDELKDLAASLNVLAEKLSQESKDSRPPAPGS
jgi:methyl-accepting chemotaxis protein